MAPEKISSKWKKLVREISNLMIKELDDDGVVCAYYVYSITGWCN